MSSTAGRVFSGITRVASGVRIFPVHAPTGRLNSVRSLTLSFRRLAQPKDEDEQVKDEPIKFSTSKASHRTWKVDRSLGSQHQRPWWKVVPLSLMVCSFLLWCALREETDIDAQLEKQLFEQIPSLLSDEEPGNKTS